MYKTACVYDYRIPYVNELWSSQWLRMSYDRHHHIDANMLVRIKLHIVLVQWINFTVFSLFKMSFRLLLLFAVVDMNVARFSVFRLVQTYQISLIGCQQIITKLGRKFKKETKLIQQQQQRWPRIFLITICVILSNPSERFSHGNFISFFMVCACVCTRVCALFALLSHSFWVILTHAHIVHHNGNNSSIDGRFSCINLVRCIKWK